MLLLLHLNVITLLGENQSLTRIRDEILNKTNPLAIIKKISGKIRPSRIRVEINDKLAKVIFKLRDEDSNVVAFRKSW